MNISYNPKNKEECPIVVFDNNVWGRMSEEHIFNLFEIKRRYSLGVLGDSYGPQVGSV